MKTNGKKLILDLVILLAFILLLRKNVISLAYHEIAGLVLFGAMALHLIANRKWIAGVTKKLFAPSTPVRTRICWILDLLLILSFCLFTLSGIMISKIVFGINASGMFWKAIHYGASMDALILMGIHLGLHAGYVRSVITKKPWNRAGKIAAVVLSAVIVVYGAYSIVSSSFPRYFSMQFSISSSAEAGEHSGQGNGPMNGTGQGNGGMQGNKGGEDQSFSFVNLLGTIATYFSIAFLFAAAAYLADSLLLRRRKKPAAAA